MSYKTTEITSDEELSDNVLHQRLFYPYLETTKQIGGQILEIGCGFGRGVETLLPHCESYTGIDKIQSLIDQLSQKYPQHSFLARNIPPLSGLADNQFDAVVTFQVIEHIEDDALFLKEIHRVLKPGGKAFITTPNIKWTLTRNPWHVREYTAIELRQLLNRYFSKVDMKAISGDAKVMEYYERNKESVKKITRFDVLNLQYRLPRTMLQVPYEIANRLNRKLLLKGNKGLVADVTTANYHLEENPEKGFDFFCVVEK